MKFFDARIQRLNWIYLKFSRVSGIIFVYQKFLLNFACDGSICNSQTLGIIDFWWFFDRTIERTIETNKGKRFCVSVL